MKIAIEGCCHGELDAIYQQIQKLENQNKYKIDLLLICGDFQAIRNHQDLQCMAVPQKYRQLGGFYKYYTGEKTAPILTIMIGGNHEASNYLWELYHGGWVAPNIYFLGHAGSVKVNGIRISGASGIFKPHDFRQGHWERVPYDKSSMRSIYHIREFNVRRLSLLPSPDIFLSHDWPSAIEQHGNVKDLLRRKPYFREDINSGKLGSPPLTGLLQTLRPTWWFSAHLHCRFEATVVHDDGQGQGVSVSGQGQGEGNIVTQKNPDEIVIDEDEDEAPAAASSASPSGVTVPDVPSAASASHNPDEILLDDEVEDVVVPPPPPSRPATPSITRFLALDKCLPRRQFLEVIDVPEYVGPEQTSGERSTPAITFDPEWLAITRAFNPWLSTNRSQPPFPEESQAREMVRTELEWVKNNIVNDSQLKDITDCQIFAVTAPPPGSEGGRKNQQPPFYFNPQTEAFCAMLGIENKVKGAVSVGAQSPHSPKSGEADRVVLSGNVQNDAAVDGSASAPVGQS